MRKIQGGITGSDDRRQYGTFFVPIPCDDKMRWPVTQDGPLGRLEWELLAIYEKAVEMRLTGFRLRKIEVMVRFEANK